MYVDRKQTTFNLETEVKERKTKQVETINRCYRRISTSKYKVKSMSFVSMDIET